jgi:hypothetical protein
MTNASDKTHMDQPISDEVLMAYADGALPMDEREAVQDAIAKHPWLMEKVESFLFTRGPLARPFDAVLTAPLPERLQALAAQADASRRRGPSKGFGWLRQFAGAMWTPVLSPAAAIPVVVLGIAAGWLLQRSGHSDFVSLDESGLVASAQLQAALDATPVGALTSIGRNLAIQPKFTFASTQKTWCRQYELVHDDGRAAGGLACRDGGVWRVIAQTGAAARPDPAKAVPAGSGDQMLDDIRAALKEKDVLGREQEQQLIRDHWQAKP